MPLKDALKRFAFAGALRTRARRLSALLRETAQIDGSAAVITPGNERVVVLAPHMDDETIGCGGTIAQHAQAGGEVTAVFLTDGRLGGPCDNTVEVRKAEARCAALTLGTREPIFLDARDGGLGADPQIARLLQTALQQLQPDIVYLPSFLDRHPDHSATSAILLRAAAAAMLRFECRAYEVWTPVFPNRLVAIDSTLELKRRALACYASQLAHKDYLHHTQGLNAFRAAALGVGAGRFAEAFYALPLSDYRRLHEATCRGS